MCVCVEYVCMYVYTVYMHTFDMKVNHECTRDIYECQLNHVGKENKL